VRGILLIALGGAVGAVGRHLANVLAVRIVGAGFPWGTLAVNVVGSFLLGWLLAGEPRATSDLRLLVGTGALGAFTTWSAFSVETVRLAQQVGPAAALANVAAQLALGLLAAALGLAVGRAGA